MPAFSSLDIKIIRNGNRLITSIFRKTAFSGAFATFSEVFKNFNSFIPVTYKFGLVYTLLHRSFRLCSTYENFHEDIVTLKNISRGMNIMKNLLIIA